MNQVFKHKRSEKLQPLEMTNEIEGGMESPDLAANETILRNYFFGMLLCLDEEQRMTIVLSDFFKMDHMAASKTLNINPDNFRKRLSRSRKDMKQWMEDKCSLVVPGKECKCNRKAQYFVEQGWVDPETMKFSEGRVREVSAYLQSASIISPCKLEVEMS
jgi:hypothetical protein